MKLSENTILITGGATGIGFALARRFAAYAGNTVIICGRRKDALDVAKEQCPKLDTIVCDLEHAHERERLAEEVFNRHPSLNVLVNNAGVQQRQPHLAVEQEWQRHAQELAINIAAPLHLSMLFARHFMTRERAAVVNVTSGLAFVPLAFVPTYSATKAALHSFSQSLRYQLRESSIEVYEVAPPAVNTDLGGPGKHSFGVAVDDFADFAMQQLKNGQLEFGYQTSEVSRTASFEQRNEIFERQNSIRRVT